MRAVVGDRGDDDNTARAPSAARAPPIMRRRSLGTGIALINLHWTPLPADALSSTIWQAAAAENAAPAEGDVLDDDTTTAPDAADETVARDETDDANASQTLILANDDEIARLEALFPKKMGGRATAAAKYGAGGKAGAATGARAGSAGGKTAAGRPRFLEMSRANNVSIGLKVFKGSPLLATPFSLAAALSSLDVEKFSPEQVVVLRELAPTETEAKAASGYVKAALAKRAKQRARGSPSVPSVLENDADADMRAVLTELLPAERVSAVLATRVPRLPRRLAALHFLATRSAVAAELRGSLALVRSAAEEVLGATRLRAVLARVLAIGNVLNEGTAKGEAGGFTLDSLLKLAETKSATRKGHSLLDYVVEQIVAEAPSSAAAAARPQAAHGRHGEASARALLGAPRRAAPIALVLEAEMPSVEAAARCPIRELWAQVTALRRELDGLDAEVGARAHEREAAADGACPIAARTRAGAGCGFAKDGTTAAAGGALEAMLQARAGKPGAPVGGAEAPEPAACAAPSGSSAARGSLLAAIRGAARPAEPVRQYREIPVSVDETMDFVERGDAPSASDLEVSAPRSRAWAPFSDRAPSFSPYEACDPAAREREAEAARLAHALAESRECIAAVTEEATEVRELCARVAQYFGEAPAAGGTASAGGLNAAAGAEQVFKVLAQFIADVVAVRKAQGLE